jgi:serine protease AprX
MKVGTFVHNSVILVIVCAVVAVTTAGIAPAAPAASPAIKVIVEGTSVASAARAVRANGGQITAELSIIKAVAAEVPQNRLARLSEAAGIVRVTPDRPVKKMGNRVDVEFSKPIGAQEVWETGNLGQDITVAVLDSGIDPLFNELRLPPKGKSNRFLAYYDVFSGQLFQERRLLRSPGDPNGHGTHVAGIIANSTYERQDKEYRGVAPAANLVAVRVLDETGMGLYSDVIQGIEWVVQNKDAYDIRVLNVSLYAPVYAPYWADPLNLATMAAWHDGIVVVTGAGNDGPDPMSIGVPGNTPYIITVGAYTDNYTPEDLGDDYIPPFSAAGPTLDAFVKPDVIAPGAHVISLLRPRTYLDQQYPENRIDRRYFKMAGTSMSTAAVSGIVALMLSENPALTPDQVKYRLTATARPQFSEATGEMAYSIWQQGAGRVWAPEAVFADIEGAANQGMDLAADLAGEEHYEGWTVYDPDTGEFVIRDDGYASWSGGYASWSGGYASWSGGYASWSGGATNWSGDFSCWIDYASWSGGYASWAGGYASWAGSYASWAGGYASWAGGYASWAGNIGDPTWAANFVNLENLPTGASSVGFNSWAGND